MVVDELDPLLLAPADHELVFILQGSVYKEPVLDQQLVVINGSKEPNLAAKELVEELDLCALDLGGKEHNKCIQESGEDCL